MAQSKVFIPTEIKVKLSLSLFKISEVTGETIDIMCFCHQSNLFHVREMGSLSHDVFHCMRCGFVSTRAPKKLKAIRSYQQNPSLVRNNCSRNKVRSFNAERDEKMREREQPEEGIWAQIFGVPSMISNVSGLAADLRTTLEDVKVQANAAGVASAEAASNVKEAINSIPSLIENFISSTIPVINITVRTALKLSLAAVCLYLASKFLSQMKSLFDLVYNTVSAIFSFPSWLSEYVHTLISANNIEAQVGVTDIAADILKYATRIVPVFATCLAGFILNKLPGKPCTPDILMRRCRDLPGAIKGLYDIHSYMSKSWAVANDWIMDQVVGENPLAQSTGLPIVEKWISDVLAASDRATFQRALANKDEAFRIMQLWYTGMTIMTNYRNILSREVVDNVKLLLITAAKMKDAIEKAGIWGGGPRMEPQMVWFTGASGIGKSTMMYYIASHILKPLGLCDSLKQAVYQRTVEQEYWDGYKNQPIVVVDDAFQMKDSSQNPNIEFMEGIRMTNMFPLNLHMADIAEKANTTFQGKSILYTTNARTVQVSSITHPEAFFRRFTFSFHVCLKEEYIQLRHLGNDNYSRTLNIELAKANAPIFDGKRAPVNLDVYKFIPFDACAERMNEIDENAPGLSFNEVAAILENDMRRRTEFSTSLLDDIERYATSLAQVGQEQVLHKFLINYVPEFSEEAELRTEIMRGLESGVSISEMEEKDIPVSFFLSMIPVESDVDLSFLDKAKRVASLCKSKLSVFVNKAKSLYEKVKAKVMSVEWLEVLTTISSFLNPKAVLISFAITGLCYMMYSYFQSSKSNTKRRFKHVVTESVHPETQPKHIPTVVVESIHPETQPKHLPTVIVESFHPETQPKHLPNVVVESNHPETQPKHMPRVIVESNHPETQPKHMPKVVVESNHPETQPKHMPKVVVEGAADQNQFELACAIRKQQYYIRAVYEDGVVDKIGNMTIVTGTIGMIPSHFLTYLRDSQPKRIVLTNIYLAQGITVTFDDFLRCVIEVKDKDLAFIALSRVIPPGKDIRNHFVKAHELMKLSGKFPASLSGYRLQNGNVDNTACLRTIPFTTHDMAVPIDNLSYSMQLASGSAVNVYTRALYSYSMSTMHGDCGSLLMVSSPIITGKIVGIHVAGSKGVGAVNFSTSVSFETVKKACDQIIELEPFAQVCRPYAHLNEDFTLPMEGEFIPLGHLQPVADVSKSELMPSSIHNQVTQTYTKPAYLKPFRNASGEVVDPLLKGLAKAGKAALTVENEFFEVARDDVYRKIAHDFAGTNRPKTLLSYEEAIMGVAGDDHVNAINRTTSPGYPWNLIPGRKPGKTQWMGSLEYDFTSPSALELRAAVELMEEKAKQGIQSDIIWVDTLKDERRPIAKVNEGKTRVFSNGPMDYTVLFRKYFMQFMAHVMDNRMYNEIAVGINPFSSEWHVLGKLLSKVGDKCYAGDFSNYDGTLIAKILWGVLDIINRWYSDSEENQLVRAVLWNSIVHSVHLCRGNVYQWTHSIPSGCPITAIVNSIYNAISMRCVYLMEVPKEFRKMSIYNENVNMCSYGDDNVVNISDFIAPHFNQVVASRGYAKIGMDYTDEAKGAAVVEHRELTDVTFLQRYFHFNSYLNRISCPSTIASRLESLNWTRRNNVVDTVQIELTTVQDVCKELALIGKTEFDEYTRKICNAHEKQGNPIPCIESYYTYLNDM
jgi:hypothetical protein